MKGEGILLCLTRLGFFTITPLDAARFSGYCRLPKGRLTFGVVKAFSCVWPVWILLQATPLNAADEQLVAIS